MTSPDQGNVSALSPLPFKPHPGRRLTEAEFLAWCDEDTRAEWKDGEVVIFMPNSVRHFRIVFFVGMLIELLTLGRDLGLLVGDVLTRIEPGRILRAPDLMFVTAARRHLVRDTLLDGAPDLAVEIVSPDSVARDYREKFAEYEAAGVAEYWLIDPTLATVHAYRLGAAGHYEPIPLEAGYLRSAVLPGFGLKPEWFQGEELHDPRRALDELAALGEPPALPR